MSEENIRKYIAPDSMIKRIFYYDETDSTNIRAKIAGETDGQDGDLFVADCQVSGRGRRGRGWTTDSKTAIAMTFLLKPSVEITTASRLTCGSPCHSKGTGTCGGHKASDQVA